MKIIHRSRVVAPSGPLAHPADLEPTEWFGRYRLWFDQVHPIHSDCEAVLGLRAEVGVADLMVDWYAQLPRINWPFEVCASATPHSATPATVRFEMRSDVCYFDMRNLHWAVIEMAPFLTDGAFFVYSSGDAADRWIDEYQVCNGRVTVDRVELDTAQLRDTRLDYYMAELARRPAGFRTFVETALRTARTPHAHTLLTQLHQVPIRQT